MEEGSTSEIQADCLSHGKEVERMTNAAAIGYMIIAAKEADMDYELIQVLERLMVRAMDRHTEFEAEKEYSSF